MKIGRWMPIFLLAVSAAACDDSSTAPEHADAVITGEVRETSEPAPTQSGAQPSGSQADDSAPSSGSSLTATTVIAASVRGDGSLDMISEADVEVDGRYTLTVPAGRSDLIVAARSSGGAEVGQVIVHQRTTSGVEVRAAPINAHTTTEGRVYARVRASGMAASAINTAELALFLHLEAATAAHAAASAETLDALAAGYVAAQAAMTEVLASAGSETSVSARAEILANAAVQHDLDCESGMGAAAAHDAFVAAALDAYLDEGVSAEALVLATAAATAGLDQALAQADAAARLDVATEATDLTVRARQRLAAELPLSFVTFYTLATESHAAIRLKIRASTSFSDFLSAVRAEEAAAEAAVTDAIMALVSSFSSATRAEVEARLEAAFVEANLSARLDASASATQKAEAIAEYRQDVRAAVGALIDSLPQGVSLDAEATAKLLMAVRAGPSYS